MNKDWIKSNVTELGRSFIYSLLWVGMAYGIMKTQIDHNTEQVNKTDQILATHVESAEEKFVDTREFDIYMSSVDKMFSDVDKKLDILIMTMQKGN